MCSARKRGNCYELADYTLNRMGQKANVVTELVNFYDYDIQPCHKCNYECFFQRGEQACPIKDDVRSIWEKTWTADALRYFIPTYGGFPPALWFAFSQRYQGIASGAPVEDLRGKILSVVTMGSLKGSAGGGWTERILRQYALANPRISIWTELNYNSTAKSGQTTSGQRTQRKLSPKVRRCESETV